MAKNKTKVKPSTKRIPPTVVPVYESRIPTIYANFASVSSTPQEIFIDFCVVAPPLDIDAKNQLRSQVITRIIANQDFAQALVQAISTNLARKKAEKK